MRARAALTAALLFASAGFLGLTLRFEAAARLVPLSVLTPLAVLLTIQLVRDVFGSHGSADSVARQPGPADHAEAGVVGRSGLEALGWIAGLGILTVVVGMIAGPSLFVLAWLRRRSRERWTVATAGGAATALAFWLIFARALGVAIDAGAIGPLLARLTG